MFAGGEYGEYNGVGFLEIDILFAKQDAFYFWNRAM